jgi:hypothetical protein
MIASSWTGLTKLSESMPPDTPGLMFERESLAACTHATCQVCIVREALKNANQARLQKQCYSLSFLEQAGRRSIPTTSAVTAIDMSKTPC